MTETPRPMEETAYIEIFRIVNLRKLYEQSGARDILQKLNEHLRYLVIELQMVEDEKKLSEEVIKQITERNVYTMTLWRCVETVVRMFDTETSKTEELMWKIRKGELK